MPKMFSSTAYHHKPDLRDHPNAQRHADAVPPARHLYMPKNIQPLRRGETQTDSLAASMLEDAARGKPTKEKSANIEYKEGY
jgi:hypothetical protein